MELTAITRTRTLRCLSPLVIIFIIFTATSPCVAFTPKDYYLLSCGASSASLSANPFALDGRIWQSDNNSTFSSFIASTSSAVAAHQDPSIYQIPFRTARIFRANFTYSFPVSPGPKFLRLYFYPATYNDLEASQFLFSVQANNHLLLKNFSAYVPANVTKVPYLRKEYYLNVTDAAESLKLTFSPATPGSYAFVNGIEVVSAPDALFVTSVGPMYVSDTQSSYEIGDSVAMETVYRLNVGGSAVTVLTDGGQTGIYRLWEGEDDRFLLHNNVSITTGLSNGSIIYTAETPNYTAPADVYLSFRSMGKNVTDNLRENLTWRFPVDVGFQYLLRLHWCEEDITVTSDNGRVFYVYINNQTAEELANPLEWAKDVQGTAVHRDYVVDVNVGDGGGSTGFIWLEMHPNIQQHPLIDDVLLNGLEIFKISRSNGSLDSLNARQSLLPNLAKQASGEPSKKASLPAIIGSVAGSIILITLLFACLFISRRKRQDTKVSSGTETSSKKTKCLSNFYESGSTASTGASSLPSDLCRHFSFAQIKLATSDFSNDLVIGSGGFGNVYKGTVDNEGGPRTVAIKRLNPMSKQGAHEFRTEIEMLSKLRHVHLVSLIGYCDENSEMILVYEYMARGTLRDHVYNTNNPPLPWTTRLQICAGAARGLYYLHAEARDVIIHRDVKSTNILIDEKWVAKVSDFGLSRFGPLQGDLVSHVSTAVKGSFGYVDPEYYRRRQLTQKSDVYSFGVVLFEVLCGRAAVNLSLSKEQVNLAVWARNCHKRGALDAIVDPNIKGEIAPECLRKFGEIAERCVRDQGIERPSMADVVWNLEFALQLQRAAGAQAGLPVAFLHGMLESSSTTTSMHMQEDDRMFSSTSGGCQSKTNEESSLLASSFEAYSGSSNSQPVFSEIFKPQGR